MVDEARNLTTKKAVWCFMWFSKRAMHFISSVGGKLFVVIFCSILGCVMTVGFLAYETAKSIVERKVSEASLQTVTQVANNLDMMFRTYEDLSLQLMFDSSFHELVRAMLAGDPQYTKSQYAGKLTDRVKSYTTGNVSVNGVLMIPMDPKLPVLEIGAAQGERAEQLRAAAWFEQVVARDGLTMWIPPQPDRLITLPAPMNIGLSRLIKDSMTNRPSYVFVMEIHAASIVQRLQDVALGEGSALSVVDGQGNYVVSGDQELLGIPSGVVWQREGEKERGGALKTVLPNGSEALAVYSSIDRIGWGLLGTVPVAELAKDAEAIRWLTWITGGAAAMLAAGIGALVVLNHCSTAGGASRSYAGWSFRQCNGSLHRSKADGRDRRIVGRI